MWSNGIPLFEYEYFGLGRRSNPSVQTGKEDRAASRQVREVVFGTRNHKPKGTTCPSAQVKPNHCEIRYECVSGPDGPV